MFFRLDVVPVLFSTGQMATGRDRYVEELIALTGDYRVARAAFAEAAKQRPGRIVTLRQKTRLLADSRRKH